MREREIAGLLRDKHPDGMQQLLLHYGPLIRYIIAPIVPDAHDREDCFSEVTLRIWEKADRFAPQRGSWKAWLTAVTRNTAYNFARQTARRGEGELPEHAPSPAPDPEEALLWAERSGALCEPVGIQLQHPIKHTEGRACGPAFRRLRSERRFLQDDANQPAAPLVDDAAERFAQLLLCALGHALELGLQILLHDLVEAPAEDV